MNFEKSLEISETVYMGKSSLTPKIPKNHENITTYVSRTSENF